MEVRSLAYRTDLMVRRLAGSTISDHGRFIVVRTPDNPGFHWGNFVLWPGPPRPGEVEEWIRIFTDQFPDAAHLAFGIDGTDFPEGDQPFPDKRLLSDLSVVMTSERPPESRATRSVPTVRPLRSDRDWDQEHLLRLALDEEDEPHSSAHLDFLRRSTDESRRLVEAGHAEYFGAFIEDRLGSVVGIASDGRGVARYQNVGTHPDFRRRGLASHLLARAGAFGMDGFGARRLVIVADAGGIAAGLYQAVGFVPVESQWGLSAAPTP